MNRYQLLSETIHFATEQLEEVKATTSLHSTSALVTTVLYRRIVELSEGVRVAGANGLSGPVLLNFRGLLEAYVAFAYIVQEEALLDTRAKAYKIGYHKQQIELIEQSIATAAASGEKELYKKGLEQHTKELMKDELAEVLAHYDDMQQRDRRKFLPKWHALYGGPRSIHQLAKYVAEKIDGDPNTLSRVYSGLSVDAHNYMELNNSVLQEDFLTIKPIKSSFDANTDTYNFTETRTFLTRAAMKYTERIHPEHSGQLKKFATYLSPYLPE